MEFREEKKEADLLIPQERRDYPRIAISVHVKYRILQNDPSDRELVKKFDPEKIFEQAGSATMVNISSSGLLMYAPEEIPEKSFVAVSMYLPLPGLSCSCRVLGECVRCIKEDDRYSIGLQFLKVLHHDLNQFKYMALKDLLEINREPYKPLDK